MRLDAYLVANALALSRNKAQELLEAGLVRINGAVVAKPSYKVQEGDVVEVAEHNNYVSRAAYKLSGFLEEHAIKLHAKRALDIGSSTGGFTQVLLQNGVSEVVAVDVGTNQLHPTLKNDSRVHSFENCDIRDFQSDTPFELVVSDVSFISLLHILDAVDALACGSIILLFKPQFEVGKEAKRDKHGVVLDAKAIEHAMERFERTCQEKGWHLQMKTPAHITGKEGNLEYCYYYEKR